MQSEGPATLFESSDGSVSAFSPSCCAEVQRKKLPVVGGVGGWEKKGPFCFPMTAIAESGRRWRSQYCEHGGACDRNSKPAEDGERSGSVNSPDCFITHLTRRSPHVTRRTDTVFRWRKRVLEDIFRGVFVVLFPQHAFSL